MDCPSYDTIVEEDKIQKINQQKNLEKKRERKLDEINKWNQWVINTNIIKKKKDNKIRISRFEKVKYIIKI